MPRGVYNRSHGSAAATARAKEVEITPLQKQSARTAYLYNLVDGIKQAFNLPIPNLSIQMGFPSRRSRGRFTSRAVGEILVQEWQDRGGIEKAMLVIHPERFINAESVSQSALLLVGDEIYGSRRHSGALTLGIEINKETGVLDYTRDEKGHHAKLTLHNIMNHLGELPTGHVEIPEPKPIQRTKMLKYACSVCGRILRAAKDPEAVHSTDKGVYILSARKPRVSPAPLPEPVPTQPPLPPPPVISERENIANLGALVEAGAARVASPAQPRAFGQ